jgi:8-oxo-dGTP diphosphatase
MLEIKTYPLGYCDESEYTRVVCVSRYKGEFVFSYNKKRKGWEILGGHIEEGESWMEAVKREMFEETGATKIEIEPVCLYKINSFAFLFFVKL